MRRSLILVVRPSKQMTTNFTSFWVLCSLALLCAGMYFFGDAMSYALIAADPETGRARGCYTVIDLWLGHLQPNDSIRQFQLLGSLAAVIASILFLSITLYKFAKSKHDGDSI